MADVESKALIKIQEQAIKLLCNLLTQAESCTKVIDSSQQGIKAIFNCLNQRHRNTVKFALGALLNYTQVFQKSENGQLYSPFHAFGLNGGIQHLMAAMNTSLDLLDYESMLYSSKLVSNLTSSPELVLVMGESQVADYLCRMVQRLKDGPKHGQTDQKLKKYGPLIIAEALKAIKQLASNPAVQYNKIQLLEKTLLLDTVRQLIH